MPKILRKILVKAIVTDEFKKKLIEDCDRSIKQANLRFQQLDLEKKKVSLKKIKGPADQQLLNHINLEQARTREWQAKLKRKKDQFEKLELASEFVQGTVEGFAEVEIGSNFYDIMTKGEIIVKDGRVVEIKNL